LHYPNKLAIGPWQIDNHNTFFRIEHINENAVAAFYQSLDKINMTAWLKGCQDIQLNYLQSTKMKFLKFLLCL